MGRFGCFVGMLLLAVSLGCSGTEVRSSSEVASPPAKPEAAPPDRDAVPPVKQEPEAGAGVAGDARPPAVGADKDAPPDADEAQATEPSAPPEASAAGTEPASTEPGTVAADPAVQALYQQCLARVEGRETDNECTADADCVAAGCSTEICTTKEAAEGMMSTCENRPCFAVLDACGCNAGRCQWSLKESLPTGGAVLELPPQ